MTDLGRALLDHLDGATLDRLADLLAPRIADRLAQQDGLPTWLDAAGAAAYLATSRDRMYDLVALHKLEPGRDGRRLLFRRSDLDAYLGGCDVTSARSRSVSALRESPGAADDSE